MNTQIGPRTADLFHAIATVDLEYAIRRRIAREQEQAVDWPETNPESWMPWIARQA